MFVDYRYYKWYKLTLRLVEIERQLNNLDSFLAWSLRPEILVDLAESGQDKAICSHKPFGLVTLRCVTQCQKSKDLMAIVELFLHSD